MKLSESQSDRRLGAELIELIKMNLEMANPGLDWSRIEFEQDTAGNVVRLRSDDPTLHEWLQQTITITRPEPTQPAVAYPNVFTDGSL